MEGDIKLPERGGISMFDYWKPILTDTFIKEIKARGGILINLASGEMKDLFDWKTRGAGSTSDHAGISGMEKKGN